MDIEEYINFLEWKWENKKYIFSPRTDNSLENWIANYLRSKKVWFCDYDYKNPEHKKISIECYEEANKIMKSPESIVNFLSDKKIHPRDFKWFWKQSYQEFLNKLKEYASHP